jgi:hypothetical protein
MAPHPALAATLALACGAGGAGCAWHADPPARPPADARGGHAPAGFDATRACSDWESAVPPGDAAHKHDSFPELDPARSCYVAVRRGPDGPHPDPTPAGCGYPRGPATFAQIDRAAARYEHLAAGDPSAERPVDLACALPDDVRRAAAARNARTLRALQHGLAGRAAYPYAAVATFGFGYPAQAASALLPYRPGDACPAVGERDPALLDVNLERARRAAEAYRAGVAPVVTVSGGAVHSPLVEAFLLDYLLTCRLGVPTAAVLVDPCAAHTHENLRNTGSLLVRALGGRTAELVTDGGLQWAYLEEWTAFDLVGGSIDQRSLRDFGYLLGSFRRAGPGGSGRSAGFWYTPYRFWAEPEGGLGGFTCVP